jgi:hypothetical protein
VRFPGSAPFSPRWPSFFFQALFIAKSRRAELLLRIRNSKDDRVVGNLGKGRVQVKEESNSIQDSALDKKCVSEGCGETALETELWRGESVCALCLSKKAVAENWILGQRITEIQERCSALFEENRELERRVLYFEDRLRKLESVLAEKSVELLETRTRLMLGGTTAGQLANSLGVV